MSDSVPPTSSNSTWVLPPDFAEKLQVFITEVIQQNHTFSLEGLKHADSMLTWAIGLMAAGVFYANELLSAAPGAIRFLAVAPWILGVLASLSARVITVQHVENEILAHVFQIIRFKSRAMISKDAQHSIGLAAGLLIRSLEQGAANKLYWWWIRLSLATYIFAGAGVLTVVAAVFLADAAAMVVVGVLLLTSLVICVVVRRATMRNLKPYLADLDVFAETVHGEGRHS